MSTQPTSSTSSVSEKSHQQQPPCPNPSANMSVPDASTSKSSAPMPSAPILYDDDGSVAWGEMWGSFCTLASEGGPPHRGRMLVAAPAQDPYSPEYQRVGYEIIRGIALVSGLDAHHAKPGWLAVECTNVAQARWMSEQIVQENVESYYQGNFFFVPIASDYTVAGEIKNVITVVAKTSHYWKEHLQSEVKTLMAWEARISSWLRAWGKRV